MSSRSLAFSLITIIGAAGCATATDGTNSVADQPSNQDTQSDLAADGLNTGGKTVFGIKEGSPDAIGVERVANELSFKQLYWDADVWFVSAYSIVDYRAGRDGRSGTSDDRTIDSLKELNNIPWVGRHTFGHLLQYARDNGYVPTGPDAPVTEPPPPPPPPDIDAPVTPPPPPPSDDFGLTLSGDATVQQGGTTTVQIATTVTSGSSESVSLDVAGLPRGVTASFSSTRVSSGAGATMTLSAASDAPATTASFTVTGTAASGSHGASANLTVTEANQPPPPPPPADFSVSLSPSAQGVTAGDTATFSLMSAVVSGTPGSLALTLGRLPAGVTGSLDRSTISPGGSATVTITTDGSAAAGDVAVTVSATDGSKSHDASATLTVNVPPPPPPPPDAPPPPPPTPPTGFRINGMWLRDPHVFINILGTCYDATDSTPFNVALNPTLNTSLGADTTPADGFLDLSPVVVFRPLDASADTTPISFELDAKCTAPASSSSCGPGASTFGATATNQSSGLCLGTVDGTTSGYTPAVGTPSGQCFASDSQTLSISLQGVTLTLYNAQIGANYTGSGLDTGLIRGFLLQSDADRTQVPLPVLGNVTLSSVLGGGTGACGGAHDPDTLNGQKGWWFYLNFTAVQAPYSE